MASELMNAFDDPPSSVNLQALDSSMQNTDIFIENTSYKAPIESFNHRGSRQMMKGYRRRTQLAMTASQLFTSADRLNSAFRPDIQKLIQPAAPMISNRQENQGSTNLINFKYRSVLSPEIQSPQFQSRFSQKETLINISPGEKQKPSSLMVGYLTRRFMTKASMSRRRKLFFKSNHFQILGDKASNDELKELRNQNQQNCLCCNKWLVQKFIRLKNNLTGAHIRVMKHLPLIYPQSLFKIIWDLVLCTVLLYFFILIPIHICFQTKILFIQPELTLFQVIFMGIDYILKLNTVFYEYGKPITDRYRIFNRYLKVRFLQDGLSCASLFVAFLNHDSGRPKLLLDIPLLLFYTQYHYFKSIIIYVEESLNLSKVTASVWALIKLILTLLFSEHLFSCLWYFIAAYKLEQGQVNWISTLQIQHESWEIKYLDSFYFSTVTMLSVGYGDITPTNSLERGISIVFMLFACVQLSYSVNTVGTIIQTLQQQRDYLSNKIRLINNYMNKNKISFDLQYQVREYLRIFLQQKLEQETQEEDQIIANLSEGLREKLIYESNSPVLMTCPLFAKHFSEQTKQILLKKMKKVLIKPEAVLTSNLEDFAEPCLCFIVSGQLIFYLNQNINPTLGTLTKGDFFGLQTFLTGQLPKQQYSSQSFVQMNVLSRTDFLEAIKENQSDYEEYCMIRDKYLFQLNDKEAIVCSGCRCKGHSLKQCPLVHLVIDKERVIKSHQFHKVQERSTFERRDRKNIFSSLQDQWVLKEISQIFQENEEERCYFYEKLNQYYQKDFVEIVPEGRTSRVKTRFQKLVRLAQSVSYMIQQPQHKFQSMKTSTHAKVQHVKKQISDSSFDKNMRQNIIKISNLLQGDNMQGKISVQEQENLRFLVIKIQLSSVEDGFDQQRSFKQYFPDNNLNSILINYSQNLNKYGQNSGTPMASSWFEEKHVNLKLSLINYMFFPFIYFQKYCGSQQLQQIIKIKQKNKDRTKQLLGRFYRYRAKVVATR